MCDHCGCRDLPPIGELMDEHDRIMELAGIISENLAAGAEWESTREELAMMLRMHAAKEEAALYPLLIATGDLDEDDLVRYELEHRELLEMVEGSHFDRGRRNELASHIEAEELELFPASMFAFDNEAWDEMDRVRHEILHQFEIPHGH